VTDLGWKRREQFFREVEVVVGVQMAISGTVMEPDAFAADELHRLVVE
jgi:hypothetical protein